MIRWLVKLGQWLDRRFPEKCVVTLQDYKALEQGLQQCKDLTLHFDAVVERLSVVEANAVHKEAVAALIKHVQQLKDEVASLKAGLGMNRVGDAILQAMLNGEPITQGDNDNV